MVRKNIKGTGKKEIQPFSQNSDFFPKKPGFTLEIQIFSPSEFNFFFLKSNFSSQILNFSGSGLTLKILTL